MFEHRYTQKGRLDDVIRLISVLSQGKYAFQSEHGISTALRGAPLSANTWEAIARAHPEFFRPQGSGKLFALLIRSYFDKGDDEIREDLTVEQTQKLIDVAIALHDKEIQRRQMNSYLFPLIIAIIALLGTIATPIITALTNKRYNNSIYRIDSTAQHIEKMLRTPPPTPPKDSISTKNSSNK